MRRKATSLVLVVACATAGSPTTDVTSTTPPELKVVPNVIGSDVDFARGVMVGTGFGVEVSEEAASGEPGVVISQSPPPGTAVEASFTVTLVVPAPPTTIRTTTTSTVDDADVVESLRRKTNQYGTDANPTLVDTKTDAQVVSMLKEFCRQASIRGVATETNPWIDAYNRGVVNADSVGERDQWEGFLWVYIWIWTEAAHNYCPEHSSEVGEILIGFIEALATSR